MKRQLTDRFCATAKAADRQAQTDYFDAQTTGLALRVSRTGHRSWTFHYTLGSRKRITFGEYPAISLSLARTRADEARVSVSQGIDPSLSGGETLKDISESYMQREGSQLRSARWRQRALDRHVYPTLGPRSISEIRRSEIVHLLDRITDSAGPVMADQTLAVIRKIMNWHAARTDDFRSPIVRGMARTKKNERARDRVLIDDEIRKVWATDNGVFSAYVRFLLLTAARRNEASEMTWEEIDGDDWTLPAARNKTKLDLVRPLSKAASKIIKALPKSGNFIFTTNGTTPINSFSDYKAAFDKASGTKGWTLHDLRRTARSLMSRAGVPTDHAERSLGHVMGGVRGTYDRYEYHEEKRQAFEALAALIERIVSGSQGDVVQLRGRRK